VTRQIAYIGRSLNELKVLPNKAQRRIAEVLTAVINRDFEMHDIRKWQGAYPNTWEIRVKDVGVVCRCVYTTRVSGFIYVLHAFVKKSHRGISTANEIRDMIEQRQKVVTAQR
jgi:phage-related protein